MAGLMDIPGIGPYLSARHMMLDENSQRLRNVGGILELQARLGAQDEARQMAPLRRQLLESQVGELQAKQAQAARERAFRSPDNLARFVVQSNPGMPEVPNPPDEIGGGPGREAVPPSGPARLDLGALLQAGVASGVIDPIAYAKERLQENKPVSLGAGGGAVPDGNGGWTTIAPQSRPTVEGASRQVQIGDQNVTQEYRGGQWVEMARGPKFARQVAPIVNVGGGTGKPPVGYRWGPKDADGNPSLVAVTGGPADKGSGANFTPEALDMRAEQYLSGDRNALSNLGRGAQGSERIIQITNRAAELLQQRGGNPQEIGRRIAEYKANSASLASLTKSYDAITAFEQTAVRNGERLLELADKTDATGVPIVERWIRAGRQATGDPDVAAFNAQLQVYRTEAARILTNPNLSGQLTDSARKEVEHFMGPGASAQQIRGVVSLLRNDFDNRKKTLESQINTTRDRIERNVGPGQNRRATDNPPQVNAKGWKLMTDAKGNKAYVGPNKEIEEVK